MEDHIRIATHLVTGGYWISPVLFWSVLFILFISLVTVIYCIKHYRSRLNNQKSLIKNLRDDSNSFRYLIETAHEGIAVVQYKRLVYLNPRMCEMSGYSETELKALPSFLPLIHPSAQDEMLANYLHRLAGKQAPQRYESLFLRKNGDSYPIEISGVAIIWQGQPATLNMLTDISYRKSVEKKMEYLAHHDSLTGLPNRVVFKDRIEQAITLAQRNNTFLAVIFIDLNGFKLVNDTYGHEVGDCLLQQVSQRLKPLFRESDTLARLGGDEFVVLLTQITDHQNVQLSMDRINTAMKEVFTIQGQKLHCHVSQGSALFPKDGTSARALLSHADKAMYINKHDYYERKATSQPTEKKI